MQSSGQRPRGTNDTQTDSVHLLPAFVQLILGSTYLFIVLCVSLIVPIIELAIGASFRHQCPIEPNIPTYLVVAGACGLVTIVLTLLIVAGFIFIIKRMSVIVTFAISCLILGIITIILCMGLFLFIWFIVGNVWVFGAKNKVVLDNQFSANYCHPTVYNFAFAILILTYILPIVGCIVQCFRGICECCKNV